MPPQRVRKSEETIEAEVREDNAAGIAGVYDVPFPIYSEEEGERYRELQTKSIEVPTYFNFEVLDQIGLTDKLMALCRRGKLDWFVRMNYPIYHDLTLEFFTSLKFVSSKSKKFENTGTTKGTYASADEPFVVLELKSTSSDSIFTDPLGGISNLNVPKSNKSTGSAVASPLLRPPPKPGQVLKAAKGSDASSIDELEDFATGTVRNKADGHAREEGERQNNKSMYDLQSFFGMGFRSNSVPKSKATPLDPLFDTKVKGKPDVAKKKSYATSCSMIKASSATNIADDLPSIFGAAPFGGFQEVDGESEDRRKARMGRHQRTQHRVVSVFSQAVADMNQREFQTQIVDEMDAEVKRCAAGKEGNMRALLSSLQYVLWYECGWEPVPLTDLVTSTSVKKVRQKGATLEQKYTTEKVFNILKKLSFSRSILWMFCFSKNLKLVWDKF
ncbi:hypothetical protein K2173_011292 [Erythroxylum novogranatense]|uniref:Uncharacterized protein n=1 Tax=Erythroxylum novogranatense TaxID=1862640 RepID=A0AAV8S9L9_9ROSI|nr:hypothetical protein K2173_011292 [Erythroxylum novogranatense]